MDIQLSKSIIYVIGFAGFLIGFVLRNFTQKYTSFLRFSILKIWLITKSKDKAVFEFEGHLPTTLRYVKNVTSIGTAMVKQYHNAQSVYLFIGDCDFLEIEENENILHRLEELSNFKALHIRSSIKLEQLRERYESQGDRADRVFNIIAKTSEQKKFKVNSAMTFRGSVVDYGVSFSIYSFSTISSDGAIYPAIVTSLSSTSSIGYATKEAAVSSALEALLKEKNVR